MLHRLVRARRAGAQGLRRFRLQAHLRRAVGLHDRRTCRRSISTSARTRSIAIPTRRRTRKACLTVLDHLFRCTVIWLAPDAVLHGRGILGRALRRRRRARCISNCSPRCRPPGATTSWPTSGARCATVRRVVTGALEIERAQKRIGSSLEAHPIVHVSDEDLFEAVVDVDLAEVCITSAATLVEGRAAGRRLPAARRAGRRGRPQSRRRHQMRALVENPHHHRRRSGIPGRLAARRQGAARMGNHAQGGGVNAHRPICTGPLTRFGLAVAAIACLARSGQQALSAVRGRSRQPPAAARPVLRFRAHPQHRHQLRPVPDARRRSANGCCSASRRWPWLLLWLWLARSKDRLTALSLGLIIGGAVGNAIDRLAYGWVADFVFFHISSGQLAVQLVRL